MVYISFSCNVYLLTIQVKCLTISKLRTNIPNLYVLTLLNLRKTFVIESKLCASCVYLQYKYNCQKKNALYLICFSHLSTAVLLLFYYVNSKTLNYYKYSQRYIAHILFTHSFINNYTTPPYTNRHNYIPNIKHFILKLFTPQILVSVAFGIKLDSSTHSYISSVYYLNNIYRLNQLNCYLSLNTFANRCNAPI